MAHRGEYPAAVLRDLRDVARAGFGITQQALAAVWPLDDDERFVVVGEDTAVGPVGEVAAAGQVPCGHGGQLGDTHAGAGEVPGSSAVSADSATPSPPTSSGRLTRSTSMVNAAASRSRAPAASSNSG